MYIKQIQYRAFRNIERAEFSPDTGFNVLWGDNAQGKTNLLEGIYLLGNLKSFRASRNGEFLPESTGTAHLSARVSSQQVERRLELSIVSTGKKVRIDGKDLRSSRDFFGHLRPILFSPEEVNLIKGSPAGRRALLDRAIFQTDPLYLERAQEFERHLRQRNLLLREGKPAQELAPWTEGLIRCGARLRWERARYLAEMTPRLREVYGGITDNREQADLVYREGEADEEALRERLREELDGKAERERRLGQTLAGPHRDDPLFLVDGRPLRLFGSQGQQRSFMLAFKTAQIMDLESRTGEPPVLLLDDMTSELDRHRQGYFFRFLLERRGQVFITTTDIQPLIKEGIHQGKFFRVRAGSLQEDNPERGKYDG
ncbi:DNA replication and repair protein RecF [Desulfuromonas versatilis]|uniref:DNA replication and repair protein RecF n=1 Tax=Desulfuromonas versatilis TaxID=2802975 RepID=A0ABM8HNF7_9BACT|nr:DNA replication/repair protein RecF [Desulfuromonas versatilis]BCR02938.1 DNA replication and repair protein RecF [Desulfuromonas versatilis]